MTNRRGPRARQSEGPKCEVPNSSSFIRMGKKTCPHCQRRVRESASRCRGCGYYFPEKRLRVSALAGQNRATVGQNTANRS